MSHDPLTNAQRLERMLDSLKEQGLRITPQRLEILRILSESVGHPSVEDIHAKVRAKFPTTSLATTYKTVALLKDLDEVLELGFADGSNRYDGNKPYPHPHVICTVCRKIMDPDLSMLRDMTEEVARETGFRITTHRLDFFGLCPDCQKK
ncbi:Fur family transcriptional regulator, peroxide stress response regulator [Desulfomicrobium norvegicum]|jgi:Fur family peroxide stress response transcriptional regulator|uniref:Fur family transcriptional regulator, peroxide stress response regulator n=1 Tax=Desulfomicrobium norvegicum (strain DSM 1741 / NCIMB 8310) TaxID=52561 RepID=A0A8G2C5W4_DESNO|nr:transcriptional repressor [Desulfomicrobium norvegicum]SFM17091.1 Fur family transcriptional regulator, peroxide stress response regulator [Desulfomicrobium norvegicum]